MSLSRHHEITATEWLLEMRNTESRAWMLTAWQDFKEWLSQEEQITDLMAASGNVTAWRFRMADAWLKTDEGYLFLTHVACELGWPESEVA